MKPVSRLRLVLTAGVCCLAALSTSAVAADAHATVQPYKVQHADPAGSYTVDADHSSVQFGIGHAGIAVVRGVFTRIRGNYTFDPRNPKADKADITIAADSLDTFLPTRDRAVLGAGFLDAATYPTIRFVASRYVEAGAGRGVLHGALTLHGVTHPVDFRVRWIGAGRVPYLPKPWGGYLSGFVADAVIDRTAFGVDGYSAGIGHKVDLHVEIEGVRQ